MHDSKIQGMKLATAPLLCELSPLDIPAVCTAIFSITNEVDLLLVTAVGTYSTMQCKIICFATTKNE